VDEPVAGAYVDRLPVFVRGWAMLPSESVARVELTIDGRPLGLARIGLPRPDVAAVSTRAEAPTSGWEYELEAGPSVPASGAVALGGVVHGSAGTTIALPIVTIELASGSSDEEPTVPCPCPGASVDVPVPGSRLDRLPAFVRGWAMFASESVARVELTLDGRPLGLARVGLPRRDIAAACACPDAPISGWEYALGTDPGVPASGTVTLGGVAHGSAGGTVELPGVAFELGVVPPEAHRSPARIGSARRGAKSRAGDDGCNVLVFTHSLDYGGAQLFLLELVERLSVRGLRFTVVSPADGPLLERFERSGARVHLSPLPLPWEHRLYDARIAELTAFAAGQAFDLVIGNTVLVHYCAEVAARLGLPSILAVHESFDPHTYWALYLTPQDPGVFDRMASTLASTSALVFEAAATRELFLRYAAPDRLRLMPYGIDLAAIDRFRSETSREAARAALGISPEQQVVLCLGTIEPRKSQTSLARAFGTIAERFPDALLALVGEQPGTSTAPYNEALVEHLGRAGMLDRVLIVPLTDDPLAWHAAADVLVCASDVESLPRVILEAMAFGTLVVSTDVFGVPEVVEHGVTGLLCAGRDEQAMAGALSEALAPRPEHQAIRAAAAERVRERHDADAYADRFLDLIGGLVDGGSVRAEGDAPAVPALVDAEPRQRLRAARS
jgi:D-inositol-3-phosphate glycosyltransferase